MHVNPLRFVLFAPIVGSFIACGADVMVLERPADHGEVANTSAEQPRVETQEFSALPATEHIKYAAFASHIEIVLEADPSQRSVNKINVEEIRLKSNLLDLCSRPWTPYWWNTAEVKWSMPDPTGNGFSVKVETRNCEDSSCLIWATPPSQTGLDAVYNRGWARCGALKVPNHCTITMTSSSSFDQCCNAAGIELAKLLGKAQYPIWVNACSIDGFPDVGL